MSTVKNDLVSVVMPCYNAAQYIAQAIESVIRQTHNNLELIIVNDGSTDGSEAIIHSFRDDRIKYVYQKNQGQCHASNTGLRHAGGDFIKFFDADDVMNESHIEAQLERLSGNENCIASCAWGRFYDSDSRSARFVPESVWQDMEPLDWIKNSLRQKYDMMGAWLWLIPKKIMDKTGGWDERLSLNNDFEFSIRLLLNAEKVLFAGGARLYYRSGITNALSQKTSRVKFEAAILSNKLGCEYLLNKENSHEMRLLCANRYQEWLFRIYPYFPDLQLEINRKIEFLGGSNRKMDGGRVMRILDKMIGWKATKRLRIMLQKMGYKKLPFN